MRILNIQVSKEYGLRICENKDNGIDFVLVPVDGNYLHPKSGTDEHLICTIPYARRRLVAEFINTIL